MLHEEAIKSLNSEQDNLRVTFLLRAADELERIMLEAVEAGVESGRTAGIIQSYNFLLLEGHSTAAEALMKLIEEEEKSRTIADA